MINIIIHKKMDINDLSMVKVQGLSGLRVTFFSDLKHQLFLLIHV